MLVALLLRVYALWDNRKEIKYALITGFIICYSLSVGFAVATMQKFFNKLQYSMSLDSCFLPEKADYLIGVWGGMTLYDVYILMFVVVNVLNKPRRRDSEIVTNLIRDGALTFMGFFALRLLKLFQSIFGGAAQTFLTPIFTWAMDGILSFHLFLKVKLLEINASTRQHQHVLQKQALIVEEVEMKLM
ncbi:hypothetical protein AcV7_004927 [Taiwanofungus camphoratus]|nr:hypothetical protein AcV7_004927 [Antrodia cinnamomea]